MQVDRKEAIALLKRKMPVLAVGGANPAPRELRSVAELPPEPDETHDGPPLEFHRLRDDAGNWTRAGMEHAIRSGGSVMHNGNLIERLRDLPDEDEMASAEENRLRAEMQRLEADQSRIDQRLRQVQEQGKDAHERAQEARRLREQRQGERLKDGMDQAGQDTLVAGEPGQPQQTAGPLPAEQTQQPAAPTGPATTAPGQKEQKAGTPGRKAKE